MYFHKELGNNEIKEKVVSGKFTKALVTSVDFVNRCGKAVPIRDHNQTCFFLFANRHEAYVVSGKIYLKKSSTPTRIKEKDFIFLRLDDDGTYNECRWLLEEDYASAIEAVESTKHNKGLADRFSAALTMTHPK